MLEAVAQYACTSLYLSAAVILLCPGLAFVHDTVQNCPYGLQEGSVRESDLV